MKAKSPFLVFQDFITPKLAEQIVQHTHTGPVDSDPQGFPIKMECFDNEFEDILYDKLQTIIPEIEQHYGIQYQGTEKMIFQRFMEGMNGPSEQPQCQNSIYSRKKWVQVKSIDLTAVLWLKDYQDTTPLDKRTEIYGGKLEFPAYDFSLVPQQGTLVIYPAGPHFISAVSPVLVGDLRQVRINIAAKERYLHNPQDFPGGVQDWFEQFV